MDEPLLARFNGRDLPPYESFPYDPIMGDKWPSAAARAISRRFEIIAGNICETLPRSADRTLALRALLDARRHAIDSLLYAEVAR